jgi:hypothetical protein
LKKFLCVEEKGFGTFCFRQKNKEDKIISLFRLWFFFCRAFFFVRVSERESSERFRDGSLRILLHSSNNAKSFRETRWKLQNHTTHFSLIEEKDKILRVAVLIVVVIVGTTTTTRTVPVLVGMTKSQRQKERERYRQHWMMFPRRRLLCLLRMKKKKKTKKKKKEEDNAVVIITRTTVGMMIARERRKRVLGLPSENDRR